MRYRLVVILLAGSVYSARSAFSPGWQNAAAVGMGGASAAFAGSPLGVWSNPGLLSLSGRFASVTFSPGRYGLSELSSGSVLYIEPTPVATAALLGTVFGFELYRETTVSLAGGCELSPGFHGSLVLQYYHLRIAGYGAGSAIGVSAGAAIRLLPELTFGFSLSNMNRPVIGDRLPSEFRIGVGYKPAEGFTVVVDLTKEARYPFDLRVGVEYMLLPSFALRAGGSTEPSTIGAGFAAGTGSFVLDYGLHAHPDLGLSHLFSVSFLFHR